MTPDQAAQLLQGINVLAFLLAGLLGFMAADL